MHQVDNGSTEISIILVSYNHEKYIKQALKSIASQVISVPYEIVIADDCSTDTTLQIIRETLKDSAAPVKYLDSTANAGITKNYQRAFRACKGRYIAVLEGDDYWINSNRIDSLYNLFLSQPLMNVCFNRAALYYEERDNCDLTKHPGLVTGPITYLSARDLAKGNFISGFSACMYRSESIKQLNPKIFEVISYDWAINMACSLKGYIGYVNEPLSVYRIHPSGVWSSSSKTKKLEQLVEIIPQYDSIFNYALTKELQDLKQKILLQLQIHLFETFQIKKFLHYFFASPSLFMKTALKYPIKKFKNLLR